MSDQQNPYMLKPYHVTITRGQKGGIGVEVSIHTEFVNQVVEQSTDVYFQVCKKLGIDPAPKEEK